MSSRKTRWAWGGIIAALFLLAATPVVVVRGSELWRTIDVYWRVRDEILLPTEAGRRYDEIFWPLNNELCQLVLEYPDIWEQSVVLVLVFEPGFQSLLDGRGQEMVITAEQVAVAEAYFMRLMEVGSPEMRQTLLEEAAPFPLSSFIGLTMEEARRRVLGPLPTAVPAPGP